MAGFEVPWPGPCIISRSEPCKLLGREVKCVTRCARKGLSPCTMVPDIGVRACVGRRAPLSQWADMSVIAVAAGPAPSSPDLPALGTQDGTPVFLPWPKGSSREVSGIKARVVPLS